MRVLELIEKLKELPQDAEVKFKEVQNSFIYGVHNCVEITLEDRELCNLVELIPTNHDSIEDFKQTIKYAYLYAKTVTLGETHWLETNRVLLRNRRIGCSISGIVQFITEKGLNELKNWLTEGYSEITKYDEIYSEWLCIPNSIKMTSVKPSADVIRTNSRAL